MIAYHWDFTTVWNNVGYLGSGLLGTIVLAAICLFFGAGIGMRLGVALTARSRTPRVFAQVFVEIFRGTPAMVQLLWIYYALPVLVGFQLSPFTAAVIAFSLYSASYVAGIFKGGIESVGSGQREAAKSLALTYFQEMRLIVLPQAIRPMIPAFSNQVMEMVKLTTIASIIAYGELVMHTKTIADQEFRPIEAYTTLAILFSILLIPLAYLTLYLEKRFSR
ncbi:amino acid ABC transporter permease [Mesorhizobium sp. M0199]|uniref:amino acid ABC transporter permease n=1 Tax=Mesorhizobium sp. M0199 TaxID=2956911 RepID=UPI0033395CD4